MQKILKPLHALVLTCLVLVAGTAHPAPLTMAIGENPAFSMALIAAEQGFFQAEGLDLKIIHCVNGKVCLKHLIDGEAQYATATDTPIVLAALAGKQLNILASTATVSREFHLLARADHGIAIVANIKGKRVGVIKGTSAHYFVSTLLLVGGIKPTEVTLVGLEGADAAAPLIQGEVDAAALFNPTRLKAQAALGEKLVRLPNPSIFTVNSNIVGFTRAAGGKEGDAVKLLRALKRAEQLIDASPDLARAIVAKSIRVSAAAMDAMWSDYDFSLSLHQSLIGSLETQARWAIREGLLPGAKMPDFLDYVDTTALQTLFPRAVSIIK